MITIEEDLPNRLSYIAQQQFQQTKEGFMATDGNELVDDNSGFTKRGEKGNARYATLGFNDAAQLDDGPMWPSAHALVDWDDDVEQRVTELVTAAVKTD